MKDVRAASDLLKPFDARLMRCYPVGSRVDDVEVMTRTALDQWN
jgi:hypothetical protein